ncbi:uncharacterized protein LOC141903072 [Tubulanus polymorphus]|uniref:uncharacterized protein LOC141903072 n=1 Tax=Tubulanus polymorphus TaxID=672921 RepID=UPI003DA22CCE
MYVSVCRNPATGLRRHTGGIFNNASNRRSLGQLPRVSEPWKYDRSWNRRIWLKFCLVYLTIAVIGFVFVVLGCIYIKFNSVLLCVSAIVAGLIILFGSCIMGKRYLNKKKSERLEAEQIRAHLQQQGCGEADIPWELPPQYTPTADPSSCINEDYPTVHSISGQIKPPEYSLHLPSYTRDLPTYEESFLSSNPASGCQTVIMLHEPAAPTSSTAHHSTVITVSSDPSGAHTGGNSPAVHSIVVTSSDETSSGNAAAANLPINHRSLTTSISSSSEETASNNGLMISTCNTAQSSPLLPAAAGVAGAGAASPRVVITSTTNLNNDNQSTTTTNNRPTTIISLTTVHSV